MSRSERNIIITERILTDDIHLQQEKLVIPERILTSNVHLQQEKLVVGERILTDNVHIIGQDFLPLMPTLLTGPVTSAGVTICYVDWTTDIPAYHRVRYKEGPGGAVITTPWSLTASTNASVYITGLSPENTTYFYDIQSCAIGDGSAAFPWYVGDMSLYFATACSGVFAYSGFSVTRQSPGGKITYLQLEWDTSVIMNQKQVGYVSGPGGLAYGPSAASGTHHAVKYYAFSWAAGTYVYHVKNRNKCYITGPWSANHGFTITGAGNIINEY